MSGAGHTDHQQALGRVHGHVERALDPGDDAPPGLGHPLLQQLGHTEVTDPQTCNRDQ